MQVEKDGNVCEELRNNLKLEREAREKLSRENERLIKEIVEMNVCQEKERLKQETSMLFTLLCLNDCFCLGHFGYCCTVVNARVFRLCV